MLEHDDSPLHATARFAVALALLLPLSAAALPQDGPDGVWEGAIEVPGQPLDVIVTLQQRGDETWTGTIDIPAQGLADYPVSDIALDNGTVTFGMAAIPGEPVFSGAWNPDEQTIVGDFQQGGATYPFTLERRGDAPAADNAMVDAETAAPVVGTWSGTLQTGGGEVRIIFHFTHDGSTLSGTMDSPDQGQTGLPISAAAFDGSTVRADLDYAGAYFEGTLTADGAALEGSWNQGGGSAPLTLQKQ